MAHPFDIRSILTRIGVFTAHPAAFAIVLAFTAGWIVFQPDTFDLHGVATIATWLMTLLIQRATHRDTQALHAKIDELLISHGEARSEISAIDQLEPEEVEKHRGASGPGRSGGGGGRTQNANQNAFPQCAK